MNYERIFDIVAESFDSEAEYCKESARYKEKHGHYAFIDPKALTDETERIYRLYNNRSADYDTVLDFIGVFEFTPDQTERLYIATRFLRRWYNRTKWQYCPKREMIDRLWAFVIG